MAEQLKPIEIGSVYPPIGAVLIIGNGLVGSCLAKDFGVTPVDYPQVDIVNPIVTWDLVKSFPGELVINAAGKTKVDEAEREKDMGRDGSYYRVNVLGNRHLAQACLEFKKYFVSISSEMAFGEGEKGQLRLESEVPEVHIAERGVYGGTKAWGEFEILTYFAKEGRGINLRISHPSKRSEGWFFNLIKKYSKLHDDSEITPTLTEELSHVIAQAYVLGISRRTLHAVGTVVTPYEFGTAGRKRLGITGETEPIHFENVKSKAYRPQFGALSNEYTQKLLGLRFRDSQEQIDYLTS